MTDSEYRSLRQCAEGLRREAGRLDELIADETYRRFRPCQEHLDLVRENFVGAVKAYRDWMVENAHPCGLMEARMVMEIAAGRKKAEF